MAADKHLQNPNESITVATLNRITTLVHQIFFDEIFHRLLRKKGLGTQLAAGESGWLPDMEPEVGGVRIGSGGDRSSGVGLKLIAGIGFKKLTAAPADDEPQVEPMFNAADLAFTTANSDGSDPRIDSYFVKNLQAESDSGTVNIIDPVAPHTITAETRNQKKGYRISSQYQTGTAAGSPVAPAPPSGFVEADRVADITIAAGSGSLLQSDIADKRVLLELDPAAVATAGDASDIVVSPTVGGDADVQSALETHETRLDNVETLVESLTGHFIVVVPDTITLDRSAAYAYDIDTLIAKTSVGSIDVTIQIDGVNVTGMVAVTVDSTEDTLTATAARSVAVGQTVTIIFATPVSSPADFEFTLKSTRT